MVSTSSQRNDTITVEVPAISKASRLPSSQQWVSSSTSTSTRTLTATTGYAEDEVRRGRIPYAFKGKWREQTNNGFVDSDDEYLGQQNKARIDTTRTSARSDNVSLRAHTDSSSQDVAAHLGAKARERERSSLLSSHSTALRRATPPLARANHASAQSIFDRPPPIPPPLPKSSALPWYLVYAPEVTSAKLDPRENVETKQDLDYISEGSQGRTSGSRATPTSVSGVSRTPSKSRMRMVPAGQRDRSRSRKLTVDLAGEDSGDSRSGGKRASKSFEDDATDSSSEASSCSSSESDSDHEETDGTDSESDELLEFKKATRRLAEVRYPDGGASSGTLLTIPSKKRKLLLEETLPGTYGSRQPSSISMIALDGLKSGIGPRAVARKSFARAIGSKLLAKKRQGSKE